MLQSSSPRRSPTAVAFAAAAMLVAAPAAAGELTGRWAFVQVTTTVARLPVVGAIYSTTTSVSLHDLRHEGSRWRGPGRICRLDIDSGSALVDTVLPARFIDALPAPMLDVRLRGAPGSYRLRQGLQRVVLGAELARPARDELPSRPDDPRVRDQDGDGKPGLTIEIDGIVSGQIYIAQRSWTTLRGRQIYGGEFRGAVAFDTEQAILGATSSMLESPPDARPVLDRSHFHIVRVADQATCDDARRVAQKALAP